MNAYTLSEKAAIAIEAATFRNNLDNSNAQFCLDDANKCFESGNYIAAFRWALKSLAHGVGILNPIYAEITDLAA